MVTHTAKLQWIERADSIFYRAMTHDETKYPDPMAFKPERFINPDGSLNDDDRIMAFGFGRRYVSSPFIKYR